MSGVPAGKGTYASPRPICWKASKRLEVSHLQSHGRYATRAPMPISAPKPGQKFPMIRPPSGLFHHSQAFSTPPFACHGSPVQVLSKRSFPGTLDLLRRFWRAIVGNDWKQWDRLRGRRFCPGIDGRSQECSTGVAPQAHLSQTEQSIADTGLRDAFASLSRRRPAALQ